VRHLLHRSFGHWLNALWDHHRSLKSERRAIVYMMTQRLRRVMLAWHEYVQHVGHLRNVVEKIVQVRDGHPLAGITLDGHTGMTWPIICAVPRLQLLVDNPRSVIVTNYNNIENNHHATSLVAIKQQSALNAHQLTDELLRTERQLNPDGDDTILSVRSHRLTLLHVFQYWHRQSIIANRHRILVESFRVKRAIRWWHWHALTDRKKKRALKRTVRAATIYTYEKMLRTVWSQWRFALANVQHRRNVVNQMHHNQQHRLLTATWIRWYQHYCIRIGVAAIVERRIHRLHDTVAASFRHWHHQLKLRRATHYHNHVHHQRVLTMFREWHMYMIGQRFYQRMTRGRVLRAWLADHRDQVIERRHDQNATSFHRGHAVLDAVRTWHMHMKRHQSEHQRMTTMQAQINGRLVSYSLRRWMALSSAARRMQQKQREAMLLAVRKWHAVIVKSHLYTH
jgi:hypothetical protein